MSAAHAASSALVPLRTDRARRAQHLLEGLLLEFARGPRPVRVLRKADHWHQRVIDVLLRVVTLGGQDRYLTEYVTTLGATIYVPDGFLEGDAGRVWETLRHERVHVRQFERFGWLGMVLLYGLLPLPLGLAYGRARLEWQGYRETLRCIAALDGLEAARDPALHDELVRRFVGPDYGWMWPFPRAVRRWIEDELRELARIESEGGTLLEP